MKTEAPPWPRCQTDASWKEEALVKQKLPPDLWSFFMKTARVSSLHAELEALVWAMKNGISLGYTALSLETDCSQIITMINEEEE